MLSVTNGTPPGPTCAAAPVETARLQWRVADGGDPARLLTDFLTRHGLPADDLSRTGPDRPHRPGTPCGAALLISAAAAARMAGAPAGPATPAPAVPDLVAVVYGHADGAALPSPPAHPADPHRAPAATPDGGAVMNPHDAAAADPHRAPPDSGSAGAPGAAARPPASGPAAADRGGSPGAIGDWALGPWRPSWTEEAHADAVRRVRREIARGAVYQVNVVGHASAAYRGDPLPALRRLAALPGARYGGLLTGPGWAVACASPETLVRVRAGRADTRPIKGTRPATAAGRRELLASAKERAEHVMIVDLARNDLSRVARTGTVRVDELFGIRRWCDLWQAESSVSATLRPGTGLADLLRALCPGGSVTGAPKLAALGVLADLEPVGRGPAMGAFGWFDGDGLDLGLTIRTAAADARRLHLWAGGGITWGSDPAAEVAEAAAKAAPLRAALAPPGPAAAVVSGRRRRPGEG
ncbi:chorismate-binding protein [Plantactinospora siamensis]|uniref:Chorismate-binding protein n=1 Tax=Plantactinospora siamensis TaxID=555372 RepID=A0ABV6NYI5_9ACTN